MCTEPVELFTRQALRYARLFIFSDGTRARPIKQYLASARALYTWHGYADPSRHLMNERV